MSDDVKHIPERGAIYIIEANLPDPFPIGWRHYSASFGPKWVNLIMLATGQHIRVPVSAMPAWKLAPAKIQRRSARRLKRNAECYGNWSSHLKKTLRYLRENRSTYPQT